MKRLFVALVLLVFLVGCKVNQTFVDSVDSAWSVIGPRYVEYVQEDADLAEEYKEARIRLANLLTRLIEEAQKDE